MLLANQIVNSRDITDLTSYDPEPSVVAGLYDTVIDTDAELRFVSTSTVRLASITPIVSNGYITGIDIVEAGNGYVNAPYIKVLGQGEGAILRAVINARGQITGVDIINKGKGYDENTVLELRNYSVLVHSDSQALNRWTIYAYDTVEKKWNRTQSQSFDTRKYWSYADWYASGYNQFTVVDFSVDVVGDLVGLTVKVGQLVKVRTSGSAGWLLLKKYADSTSVDWTQSYEVVGSQNGTIQLSNELYYFANTTLGFDGDTFDGDTFDNTAVAELRIILNALRDKIFVDTLRQTYLDLFFACLRYAFAEQNYVDWAFKTSFVRAQHNVGPLKKKVTYNNDNLADFEAYIEEVKPYRTKVREFVSSYTGEDTSQLSVTDFDVLPVRENNQNTTIVLTNVDGDIQSTRPEILEYPWKHWLDNVGFEITEIVLTSKGSGYITPPVVRFEGGYGSGAVAKAFISNGQVNRILLISSGEKFLSAPIVVIDGGLSVGGTAATAIAKIGNSVVRSNLIKMKFDRVSKTYFITELEETATFTGTGSQLQFVLKWAPDVRVGKCSVTFDGVDALRDDYVLATAKSTSRGYTSYYGTITFTKAPAKGTTIVVSYIKDWSLLSAADRIQYYYDPTTGQLGKDLAQLMSGVDYGGTIITGLDFSVSSGWDSLPYFSDAWDSIDPTFDDYIVRAGLNSNVFTLPYIPETGEKINIYHNGTRIDDPEFGTPGQVNGNATMPTFVGNGVDSEITLPSIAVTRSTNGSVPTGATDITMSSVDGIQIGSLLLAPNVVPVNTTVTAVTGNIISITHQGEISGTTLTMAGLNSNYIGMRVTGNGVQPNTYIVSTAPGLGAVSEVQNIEVSGTAIGTVTFLGAIVANSNAGDDAAQTVVNIVADRLNVIETWNLANPTKEIENIEIDFENGPIQGAGSTTIKITYASTEGDVGLIGATINNGISFGESTVLVEGIAGSLPTATVTVSQTITLRSLTFIPVVELSEPTLAEIPTSFELLFGDTTQFTLGVQPKGTTKLEVSSAFNIEVGTQVSSVTQYVTTNYISANTTVTAVDSITSVITLSAPVTGFIADDTELTFGYNMLYFRKSTSDGSIKPLETDYDTAISGGNLEYSSATGLAADDIIIDGDDFVTPTSSNAPEEVVPGQISDAVAIKVFYRPTSGSSNIRVDNYSADGVTNEFTFSQKLNSKQALLVKVDNEIVVDYTLDYNANKIILGTTPSVNQFVSIYSFGFNGANVLDIDYFVGNGVTTEFITRAPWLTTISSAIYVNGVPAICDLFRTDDTYESSNMIGIRFSVPPTAQDVVNYVIVEGDQHDFSIVRSETLVIEDARFTYNLLNQLGDSVPLESNILVRINQEIIPAANNSYFTIAKNRLNYKLEQFRALPYDPDIADIKVYADGALLRTGLDYTVDLSGITVTITKAVYSANRGKILTVSISKDQAYTCTSSTITFTHALELTDEVEIISAFKHDILDIQRTNATIKSNLDYTADTPSFYNYVGLNGGIINLDRAVKSPAYIWVIKNKQLLAPSIDYKLNDDKSSITLLEVPSLDDSFEFITFGSNTHGQPISNIQFKDMLNRTHFKRLSANKQTVLTQDLHYYDTVIVVDDASTFDIPNPSKNRPGIIEVYGERIEYFKLVGNTLSQLRRGTLGTGIRSVYPAGTAVQDIGVSETIPYKDSVQITQFTSDDSNLVTLNYVPIKSTTSWEFANDFTSSIPSGYGQCDDAEVFVGGYDTNLVWASGVSYEVNDIVNHGSYQFRCVTAHTSSAKFVTDTANWQFFVGNIRLKKHPFNVHNVNVHPESPEGDVQFDPDFSVDGTSSSLRLTNDLTPGTRVTVVRKVGKMWNGLTFNAVPVTFDGDSTLIDTGNTTIDINNSTAIANSDKSVAEFLKETPGIWPNNTKIGG